MSTERRRAGDRVTRVIRCILLVSIRVALKYTQKFVAEMMGTQQSTVSDYERGSADPRLSTIQRYARSVGCRVDIQIVEEAMEDELIGALSVHYNSWLHTARDYEAFDEADVEPEAPAVEVPHRWESSNYRSDFGVLYASFASGSR